MAKTKHSKLPGPVEQIRPYLERALTEPAFRKDLMHALEAARELYGPLAKAEGGIVTSAKVLATDKKAQESLRKAVEELGSAATTLKGGKSGAKKGRKGLLLAGVVAGALYNPWTGAQTRQWLLERIAGDDDLQPLQDLIPAAPDSAGNGI
jgi:hypothetical protein